ncbi:hypothetical protein V6N11_027616 [Hibiscus sabdariffa]|uniref:VTT domain-containing protein n=1 Tax=Hibiscus sabdariffa TaxID=183260 RepID=A0ABR1ZNG7_9ROSI
MMYFHELDMTDAADVEGFLDLGKGGSRAMGSSDAFIQLQNLYFLAFAGSLPTFLSQSLLYLLQFLAWLGGGYLFGLPVGFIADSIGATLGATVAFVFGRTIGRSCVISKLRNYSQFQAVAIASERSGFKAYSFAASTRSLIAVQHVELPPFGDIGSFRGPTTFGMVYVGTTLKDLSDVTHGWDEVSTSHQVLMSLGFVLSVILIFCITKVAKGALEKALAESAKQDKILGPSMLPIVIVADNSSLDLHKPFVISSTQENERQSLV